MENDFETMLLVISSKKARANSVAPTRMEEGREICILNTDARGLM